MRKILFVLASTGTWPSPKPHSGRLSQRRRCLLWYAERPRSLLPCFETARRRNVRYWHKADIGLCTAHVRFWG